MKRLAVCLVLFVFVGQLLWVNGVNARQVTPRVIKVGIAVSPSFKSVPQWEEKFRNRLAYASQIFERTFKIK
ncbi:MAG: hypothetical protein PHS88_11090, partial [Candidatus Omnitrophica bacterium]|nr:hypothetical protein [Candidatus Omnitrophota bacterium]